MNLSGINYLSNSNTPDIIGQSQLSDISYLFHNCTSIKTVGYTSSVVNMQNFRMWSGASDEVDGYTGATPQNGRQQYAWDGKDDDGHFVANGTYRVFIEGTLYWSSRVLYQGQFTLGGESAQIALTQENNSDEQTNRDMLTNVTAEYVSTVEPSAVRNTRTTTYQTSAAVHDLQGRRVGKAVKSGLYIENGKKIFIKNR